jgi:hypothetical protein
MVDTGIVFSGGDDSRARGSTTFALRGPFIQAWNASRGVMKGYFRASAVVATGGAALVSAMRMSGAIAGDKCVAR